MNRRIAATITLITLFATTLLGCNTASQTKSNENRNKENRTEAVSYTSDKPLYDIQLGFFKQKGSEKVFLSKLDDNLSIYRVVKGAGSRILIDTNLPYAKARKFIENKFSDSDAFVTRNEFDINENNQVVKVEETIDRRVANHIGQERNKKQKTKNNNTNKTNKDELAGFNYSFNADEDQFVSVMKRYIKKEYKNGYYNPNKKDLSENNAKLYAESIYDAAKYYNVDPFLLTAIANWETGFKNIDGDLKRKTDHAEGIYQILKSTQRLVYEDMQDKGIGKIVSWRPGDDLKKFPKDQAFLAGHYVKHFCLPEAKSEREKGIMEALNIYNWGKKYPGKVMNKFIKAKSYFRNHS